MKLNLNRRRAAAGIVTLSLAAAAVAGTGLSYSSSAAGADAAFSAIVLGVGETEASRTLGWYSSTIPAGGEEVQLATKADFSDEVGVAATLTSNITTDASTGAALTNANGKAYLNGLAADTTYYYRIAQVGTTNYSPTYSFKTGELGNGPFQFLFFGDPQIGAGAPSTSVPGASTDAQGWAKTLDNADVHSPQAELYVSGGDQIDAANNENQWNDFLLPDQLRSTPWAATIGNHDVSGYAYEQHFALPKTVDRNSALYASPASTATTSGGDYYYTYKGVLFIDLNSNAYSPGGVGAADAAHVAFVTDVINHHKGSAKHVVLVYHHSIYSPASHTTDAQNVAHRKDFTKTFSDLGVDLVLQGHDHSYSRSYALKSTADGVEPSKADATEQPGQGTVVAKEGGVIYVTANSASGSKYYGLSSVAAPGTPGLMVGDSLVGGPQAYTGTGAVKTRLAANSVENQEYVQTYIEVTVNDQGLAVKNVRAGDNTTANSGKAASGKGGVNGAGVYGPVGSVVDQFSLFRSVADISTIVPPVTPRTLTVPGPTVTETATPVPAPTVTVTATPVPAPTVTVTADPVPAPTVTVTAKPQTIVKEVVPVRTAQALTKKIASLTKQIKKAKGTRKARLKAELAAYKAIQQSLR